MFNNWPEKLQKIGWLLLPVCCFGLLVIIQTWYKPAETVTVGIEETTIQAEVAADPSSRARGLSGRSQLQTGRGMLFAYPQPTIPQFWMQDMHFAIDIIWIDKDWRIQAITRNVTPETYPRLFSPAQPVQYVLEVPAGYGERVSIQPGQFVEINGAFSVQ